MRVYLATIAALCIIAATLPPRAVGADFAVERFKRVPFVMGHRACWDAAVPENSIRGIDLCIKNNVDMIEVDIHRTRDGVLVLIHDDTLDRTTTLTGRVDEITYTKLRAARLRAGAGGPNAAVTTEAVPTLTAALRKIRGKAILFLDIKAPRAQDKQQILNLVSKENAREYVAMYLFSVRNRLAVQQQFPDWVMRHSIVPVVENAVDAVGSDSESNIAAAIGDFADLHPLALMVFLKDANFLNHEPAAVRVPVLAVPIYGFAGERDEGFGAHIIAGPEYIWGDLLKAGATGFMTNHPLELIEYGKRWEKEVGSTAVH